MLIAAFKLADLISDIQTHLRYVNRNIIITWKLATDFTFFPNSFLLQLRVQCSVGQSHVHSVVMNCDQNILYGLIDW